MIGLIKGVSAIIDLALGFVLCSSKRRAGTVM